MQRYHWILFAPALAACAHASTQARPEAAEARPARTLDESLERLGAKTAAIFADRKTPNAAIGVVHQGRLIWFRGFGHRDVEGKQPVDTSTAFRIGSITKTLTAVALLQLRDAGKLSLDDPLTKWVPEASQVVNPGAAPIRLRNLVTHTSGLGREVMPHEGPTRAELLAALQGLKLEFEPGTKESYSNYAMALAGVVVERASGEPYRQYMQHHVFDPLGLSRTAFDAEGLPAGSVATGYERVGQGPYQPIAKQQVGGAMESCGGLYSTVEDLAKYASFELGAWWGRDSPVLSAASRIESQTPAPLPLSAGGFVGVNWFIDSSAMGRKVSHSGSIDGYSANVSLFPNYDLAVIVLTGTRDDVLVSSMRDSAIDAMNTWVPGRDAKLGPEMQLALHRLIDLIDSPFESKFPATFSDGMLAWARKKESLPSFVERVRQWLGHCPESQTATSGGLSTATVYYSCEKARAHMEVSLEASTGLIDGWLVIP